MITLPQIEAYVPPVAKSFLLYPELVLVAPVVLLILWTLILWPRKNKELAEIKKSRRVLAGFLIFSRTILVLLVLAAIASPFFEREETLRGEPQLKVLVDNSTSMSLYELGSVPGIVQQLENGLEVEVVSSGDDLRSPLGQDIIGKTRTGDTVLVVSDGRVSEGPALGDVIGTLKQNNVTVFGLSIPTVRNDYFVNILSPSKATQGVDTPLGVNIGSAGEHGPVRVMLELDGRVIIDKTTDERMVSTSAKLAEGYHKLKATITPQGEDTFAENNVAYGVVKVTALPKVVLVTDEAEAPLARVLSGLYDLSTTSRLPAKLDDVHAVILDDVPASALSTDDVDRLTDYVVDGNGLFAVGGQESYEKGGYKSSGLEAILPAFVGANNAAGGESSVVIVIDISSSSGNVLPTGERGVDVQKALALQAVRDLSGKNQVGIVAFNHEAYVVSPLQYNADRTELETKVKKIYDFGGTLIEMGLLQAMEMLDGAGGSKNIILISDGVTRFPGQTMSAAYLAADKGIRVYTVGVGSTTNEELMDSIARVTHGTFFAASNVNRLRILFGDPEDLKNQEGPREAVILDSNHFITQVPELEAKIGGYNFVSPKSTAQLLVATSGGESLLAVWRLGLGRVATLATDNGGEYAGQLYSRSNSGIVIRTVNWLIGSPDRLQNLVVDVDTAHKGSPSAVVVSSPFPPNVPGIDLVSIGERSYQAEIVPENVGFGEIAGVPYAVNSPLETAQTGIDPELEMLVLGTGGKMVSPSDLSEFTLQVKSSSKRTIVTQDPYRWPLVLGAAGILFFELLIRRILQQRMRRRIAEKGLQTKA